MEMNSLKGSVKVPKRYLKSWHKILTDISMKQANPFPKKVLEVYNEIESYADKQNGFLLDVPASTIKSWSEKLTIYVGLAAERFLLPPVLCDSAERVANQVTRISKPHVRYATDQIAFLMQEVKEHYYGGFELTLSDENAIEVDLFPLSSCKELTRFWLAVDKVTELDLTPLSSCTGLESVYVSISSLDEIDLSPLSACIRLRSVDLLIGQVSEIDLSPLKACKDLYSINISNSNLKELDLSPLEENTNLRYLTLDSNHLTTLDLSPLSKSQSLSTLSLENNALPELDLSPLSSCQDLQYLEIGGNALSSINLSPLAETLQIRKLKMESNRLKGIDLEPLKKLKYLYDLNLGGNRIHAIDLNPLSRLSELQEISLHGNRITDLELSSLMGCKQLSSINLMKNLLKTVDITGLLCSKSENLDVQVDSDVVVQADAIFRSITPVLRIGGPKYESVIEWRPLRGMIKESGWKESLRKIKTYLRCLAGAKRFAAKKAILEELGMSELSGVDKDIMPLLESVEGVKSFKAIKAQVYDGIVGLVKDQLEEGGSTFFLDVDAMKDKPSSHLIDSIHQRRIEEVNSTIIPVKKGRVHLEPLWLTHYGFHTLTYFDMPLKNTSEEKFKHVRKRLKEMGLKPTTKRFKTKRLSKKYSVKMSRELKQYILDLASET